MKILLFSESCFNDNMFPHFKAMTELGYDVTCLINLSSLKVMLFNIDKRLPKQSIIKASDYIELRIYEDYMNMDNLFLINHGVNRKQPWRDITRTFDVIRFIEKGQYDIIHTDFVMTRSYQLLYKLYGKKMVFVQHDPFPHSGMEWSRKYKKQLRTAYKYVRKFVILNPIQYNEFCLKNKIDKERVLINSLGPLDCINLYKDDSIIERKNNILFFGRISCYKGIEYLCEAMVKVHNVIPDVTVTIAGSGNFNFDISKYDKCSYFEIHNRFIEEDELAKLIQECSISICYYTDATQSGGVLTSFSLNKPVIASDIDTMRELIQDGINGILVKPKDSDALATAIISLLQNDEKRLEIASNIEKEYLNGERSWNQIVEKYVEFYKK